MRKIILLTIILWLVFVVTNNGFTQKVSPYPIGFVFDITGPASNIGIPEKRTAEMEIGAINASGGINGRLIKPIYYDSETDASKSVLHTKRLIDMDKVIVCAGYTTSGATMAAIQAVEMGKTPLISGASSEKIWILTKKMGFQCGLTSKGSLNPYTFKYFDSKRKQ